jgi:hypothetical protein
MKRCSFCDFRTETQADFDAHMKTVHRWGEVGSRRTTKSGIELGVIFVVGAFVAILIDFVLSLNTVSIGSGSRSPDAGQIVISWAVTAIVFAVLYRMNRWAGYGMLGGFVALFVLLAVTGGALGPYTCFSTYGYPRP